MCDGTERIQQQSVLSHTEVAEEESGDPQAG